MKIISRRALEPLTLDELHRLFADVTTELTASGPDMPGRRNALASLETIEAEIHARHLDL
jgi:hypothetical protein